MFNCKQEQWLRSKYDLISQADRENHLFISLKIKRLRNINRIYGQSVGDELLDLVHQVILDWLEPGEFCAHIYGGYFNLLLRHKTVEEPIKYGDYSLVSTKFSPQEEAVIVRVTQLVRAIWNIEDERFNENTFVGLGIYNLPKEPLSFDISRYNADICRVESVDSTLWNSHLEIYGTTYRDPSAQILDIRKKIVPAIESGYIKLYLQPKVDLKTGGISGAEALVRWVDPVRGMIPLPDFLPALERNGLIQKLDLYMFELVCECIEKWLQNYDRPVQISVNLSKYYFNSHNFWRDYMEVFNRFQIPTSCIEFELLESIAFNDMERLRTLVAEIRERGFSCSLDDFGSGFSSYSALANANLSTLKLDRSLFQNDTNRQEKTVAAHIVKLAHELGMGAVAEGVETENYVRFLREIECDTIQGFVFYRPMPADEFETRFVRGRETVTFK